MFKIIVMLLMKFQVEVQYRVQFGNHRVLPFSPTDKSETTYYVHSRLSEQLLVPSWLGAQTGNPAAGDAQVSVVLMHTNPVQVMIHCGDP